MGTSTDYSAPGAWGGLKGKVTRKARKGTLSPAEVSECISDFIGYNGGAAGIAKGGGGSTKVATGAAAAAIGQRLGGFLSAAAGRGGLAAALKAAGWTDLQGKPVGEILSCLLDRLGGDSSTIDQVDARMALSRLQDKYFAEAKNEKELERLLAEQGGDNLERLLSDYFGFYLYEVFCRVFFERLVSRVGEDRAHSFLGQIESLINATLADRVPERDMSKIDWAGTAGQELSTDILETTLRVLGG